MAVLARWGDRIRTNKGSTAFTGLIVDVRPCPRGGSQALVSLSGGGSVEIWVPLGACEVVELATWPCPRRPAPR